MSLPSHDGWEEAIPCAGCQMPTNGKETEDTGVGRMHVVCAILWNERDAAKSECWLCGRIKTANEGGFGDYGTACFDCSTRAWRARLKQTRAIDVACPKCHVKQGKPCVRVEGWAHEERNRVAMDRQQAMFAALLADVEYVPPEPQGRVVEQLSLFEAAS